MSNLKYHPLNVIVKLAIMLMESKEFNTIEPYLHYRENKKILEKYTSAINVYAEPLDLEFISKFINDNYKSLRDVIEKRVKISSILDNLVIPKSSDYKIEYEVSGPAFVTYYFKITRESYEEEWVKEGLTEEFNEGYFDYWEGSVLNKEIDSFEVSGDLRINDIEEINEFKKPMLGKLVMENTKEILDSLDKETLINLRNLINQKISSF